MRILGSDKLEAFRPTDRIARKALAKWRSVVLAAKWVNFAEVKQTFNSADYVKPITIFDVGGNKYRVIALVNYELQAIAIQHVLTHEEYDKGGWK